MSGTTRVLLALVVLALTIEAAGAKRARSGGAKHGDGEVVRAQGGPRTRRARPGVLELHELPGRPLYVRGGNKALQLTRVGAQSADALRSTSPGDGSAGKQAAVKQYLVRVWFPRPEGLADYLQELAGGRFFRYLPHDTYVIAMSKAQLEKARQAAGVTEVFELPAAMKIAPGLVARIDVAGSGGEGDMSPTHHAAFLETVGIKHRAMPKSHARGQAHLERSTKTPSAFVVQVMLASGGPGWALEAQAAVVAWEVAFDKMGLSITTKLVSPQKAVVTVEGVTALKKVTVWLSHQPLVHWVQEKQEITVRNSHATKAMQSVDASSRVVWNHGITGTGQVVGVADTGIDYDSCYFQDTQMPIPPRCSGTGYVMTAGCINQNHRKIVTYRKFLASDYTDYSGGHGTHVAGSVAGAALNASGAAASEVLVHVYHC